MVKKAPEKTKPVIKKQRRPSAPRAQEPLPPISQDEDIEIIDDMGDEDFEGFPAHKNNNDDPDRITEPSKSIFKHGKSFNDKCDGTFNDFTDGVMFNPSESPMGFDSEWVRFLNQLSADETTKSMADYIRIAPLTRRAKYKLMIYIKTLLDREFTMSNIIDQVDMTSLNLDKLLIDADLTLGLTRFDLSPEFQHIVNLVRIKFGIKSRRSLYGFERINVNTQRSVSENTENQGGGGMEVRKSIQSRIKDLFKGE